MKRLVVLGVLPLIHPYAFQPTHSTPRLRSHPSYDHPTLSHQPTVTCAPAHGHVRTRPRSPTVARALAHGTYLTPFVISNVPSRYSINSFAHFPFRLSTSILV